MKKNQTLEPIAVSPRPRGRPGLGADAREKVIASASEILIERGLDGMKARAIAERSGLGVGSIYKLFDDIDGVTRAVNLRTYEDFAILHRQALDAASLPGASVQMRLMALARAYVDFVLGNSRRWSALLTFNANQEGPGPEAYAKTRQTLFDMVDSVMIDLPRLGDSTQRTRATHALWASVHGMVVLGLTGQETDAQVAETIRQIETIVGAVVRDAGG